MRSSRLPGTKMMPSERTRDPLIFDVVAGFVTYFWLNPSSIAAIPGAWSRGARTSLLLLRAQPLDLLEPALGELVLALLLGDGDGGFEVTVLVRRVEAAAHQSDLTPGGGRRVSLAFDAIEVAGALAAATATAERRPRDICRGDERGGCLMPARARETAAIAFGVRGSGARREWTAGLLVPAGSHPIPVDEQTQTQRPRG